VRKTKTQVSVQTRTQADVALRSAGLYAEEEKVLRMRYGIPMDLQATLEMRGQDHDETRAQLAQLEQRALAAVTAPQPGVDSDRRAAIIERLRKM